MAFIFQSYTLNFIIVSQEKYFNSLNDGWLFQCSDFLWIFVHSFNYFFFISRVTIAKNMHWTMHCFQLVLPLTRHFVLVLVNISLSKIIIQLCIEFFSSFFRLFVCLCATVTLTCFEREIFFFENILFDVWFL